MKKLAYLLSVFVFALAIVTPLSTPAFAASYISASKGDTVKIVAKTAAYEKPSYSSAKIGYLYPGMTVKVISQPMKQALYVERLGKRGYITASTSNVALVKNGQSDNSTNMDWEVKADKIIAFGMKFLGTPYGSGNIETTGKFNCSTFTDYIFTKYGINLPGGARNQSQVGKAVGRNDLRKGDLVFFSTPITISKGYTGINKIGHVGVYIGKDKNGKDQILHTYGSPGVVINKMDDSNWWDDHFITARRVIN
jgi:cell wall-associated NlpC family hydrolase